jgi:hypothetical protein
LLFFLIRRELDNIAGPGRQVGRTAESWQSDRKTLTFGAVMALDTLTYARRLKQAGVPDAQAEAMADATREFVAQDIATKSDVAALATELGGVKAEIAGVEQRFKAEIAGVEQRFKAEIAGLEQRFRAEIVALEQRLTTTMENLSLRLTVRMGIMLAAAVSIMTAIIGLLIRLH